MSRKSSLEVPETQDVVAPVEPVSAEPTPVEPAVTEDIREPTEEEIATEVDSSDKEEKPDETDSPVELVEAPAAVEAPVEDPVEEPVTELVEESSTELAEEPVAETIVEEKPGEDEPVKEEVAQEESFEEPEEDIVEDEDDVKSPLSPVEEADVDQPAAPSYSAEESHSRTVSVEDTLFGGDQSRRGSSDTLPAKDAPSYARSETSSMKDVSTPETLFKPEFSSFEMVELTHGPKIEEGRDALVVGVPPHEQEALTLSDDDPENARNWSRGRVALINLCLCIWVLSLTYGSTAYIASVPTLMFKWRVSQEWCIAGISLNVLGFAAGPLIFGPASELYGRRPVYAITGALFTAFAFGVAFADSLGTTLVCRFFVGFFGSAALNNVPASIGDYTTEKTRGPCSILYALMAFGGPAIGPIASSHVVKYLGSDWNLRIMAIFTGFFSLTAAFIPETYGPVLLRRRLQKAGKAPPLSSSVVFEAIKSGLYRPFAVFVTEPLVTAVTIYLGVVYAILYAFFEAFGIVYLEARGFSFTDYGLTYISLAVGFFIGCVLLAVIGQPLYLKATAKAQANGTRVPPEARLSLALMAGILTPVSLFMFAWTAPYPSIHWAVPCIAEFLFGISVVCLFTSFIPYLVDVYTPSGTSASVLACTTTFRSCLAAAFPLFTLQFYGALGIGGATSLLAGVCLLMAPIPFVFKWKGHRLRARSRYAD